MADLYDGRIDLRDVDGITYFGRRASRCIAVCLPFRNSGFTIPMKMLLREEETDAPCASNVYCLVDKADEDDDYRTCINCDYAFHSKCIGEQNCLCNDVLDFVKK